MQPLVVKSIDHAIVHVEFITNKSGNSGKGQNGPRWQFGELYHKNTSPLTKKM